MKEKKDDEGQEKEDEDKGLDKSYILRCEMVGEERGEETGRKGK